MDEIFKFAETRDNFKELEIFTLGAGVLSYFSSGLPLSVLKTWRKREDSGDNFSELSVLQATLCVDMYATARLVPTAHQCTVSESYK